MPELLTMKVNQAIEAWFLAGFDPTLLNASGGNGNYNVDREWRGTVYRSWDGEFQPCTTFSLNIGP